MNSSENNPVILFDGVCNYCNSWVNFYIRHDKKNKLKFEKELTPITVYISAAGLGIIGYVMGELTLGRQPHPLHWVAGLVGFGLGYLIGKLMVRRDGDFLGF